MMSGRSIVAAGVTYVALGLGLSPRTANETPVPGDREPVAFGEVEFDEPGADTNHDDGGQQAIQFEGLVIPDRDEREGIRNIGEPAPHPFFGGREVSPPRHPDQGGPNIGEPALNGLFERRVGPPLPREFDHFIIGKPSPHPLYGRGGPLKGREGTGSPSNPEHDNGEAVLIMPAPGLADPHPSVGASPPGTERRGTPNPANESPPSAPERRNDMRPAKPLPNHLKPKGGPSDLPVAGGASGATVKPR